jgi:two-component system, LytTR family, response regulator
MKVRVLIVDDEKHAREGLRIRLEKFPAVEIIGECSSGMEAVTAINELRPDLVLLDIHMPELNGFEILRKVDVDPMPIVVFVTAYDKYAIKAFEFHALDYLLKPIGEERLKETMEIVLSQVGRRNIETYAVNLREMVDEYLGVAGTGRDQFRGGIPDSVSRYLDRIAIKTHGQVSMIPVSEIDWIESAGDYVYIHSGPHKHIIRETMRSIERRIDPARFVRIHRSTIVNVDRIRSLKPNEHGDFEVHLQDGEKLKLSRTYRSHFQKVIGNSF